MKTSPTDLRSRIRTARARNLPWAAAVAAVLMLPGWCAAQSSTPILNDEFATPPPAADPADRLACKVAAEYVARINAGRYDEVGPLFGEHAIFLAPTGQRIVGRLAIGRFYERLPQPGPPEGGSRQLHRRWPRMRHGAGRPPAHDDAPRGGGSLHGRAVGKGRQHGRLYAARRAQPQRYGRREPSGQPKPGGD